MSGRIASTDAVSRSRTGGRCRAVRASILVAVLYGLLGASSAEASTINSFQVTGRSGTDASCAGPDQAHRDDLPGGQNGIVMGSGPFTLSHTFAPPAVSLSCSGSSSATSSTAGNLATSARIDASGRVSVSESSQATSASSLTAGGSPVGSHPETLTQTVVHFTITTAMPFTFAGSFSSSGTQPHGLGGVSYSLVQTSPASATIFSKGELNPLQGSPNLAGTLAPGTYSYVVQGDAGNEFGNETGSETDSYRYGFDLNVGHPTPPPKLHCVVPKLKGKKLKAARQALTKAHCKLGRVRGRRKGRVKHQSRRPGTVLPAGTKVDIKLR